MLSTIYVLLIGGSRKIFCSPQTEYDLEARYGTDISSYKCFNKQDDSTPNEKICEMHHLSPFLLER